MPDPLEHSDPFCDVEEILIEGSNNVSLKVRDSVDMDERESQVCSMCVITLCQKLALTEEQTMDMLKSYGNLDLNN